MKNLESPQILSDLYRDLRDRRLLPLVVVLIVGMAVVPIALSKSPEAVTPAPPPATPVAEKSNAPTEQVVVSDPGLRDYKKRLSGEAPKDPFIQQFLPPVDTSGSGDTGGESTGDSGSTAPTTTGTTTSGTTSGSTAPSSSGGTTTSSDQPKSKLYYYRSKIRAGQLNGEPLKVYNNVGPITPLPGKKTPVVQFIGTKVNNLFQPETAIFLVSSAVSSASGEGSCSYAGSACQVLSLKPGEHEDLVWSDGQTYRIDLVKFNLVSREGVPGSSEKAGRKSRVGGSKGAQKQIAGFYFSF